MRKFKSRFFLVSLVLLVTLSSCEISQFSGNYKVYKNFSSVAAKQSTSLPGGEPIIGVLLAFTSEGAHNGTVKPVDNFSFCIYCLFGERIINGDGMEFNYILYVPEDIRTQYRNGGGKYPQSGDPFWWYMSMYFGLSLNEIMNNWPAVIEILCSNEELPRADSEDFKNSDFYEPPWYFKTTEYNMYQVREAYNDINCLIKNFEAYINKDDESKFIFSFDYNIQYFRSTEAFDPPDALAFYNIGPVLYPDSGKLVIQIPTNLFNQINGVTIRISGNRVLYSVYIRKKVNLSKFPKHSIPIGSTIFNIEDRDDSVR